MLNQTMC